MDSEAVLRAIDGFPGYFVSITGDIFTTRPRNGKGTASSPLREVAQSLCAGGRYLQFGADKRKMLIHQAVARAFHGAPPEGMEVSHRDGDSFNNAARNLVYQTHRENESLKVLHGTSAHGARNPMAKLSVSDVADIKERLHAKTYGGMTRLAKEYGVSVGAISMINSGKRWKSGEF